MKRRTLFSRRLWKYVRPLLVKLAVIFSLTISIASTALCEEKQAATPATVTAGVYLNQVYGVNLKENRFTADFYVWFRYLDDTLSPLDTMEIVNGKIDSKTIVVKKKIGNVNYVACRIVATIIKFWDISQYPLDRNQLTIEIEDVDKDDTQQIFTADIESSGISPNAQVRGWDIERTNAFVKSNAYNTNYGDISLPKNNSSSYSRLIYSVDVLRPGLGQFFKLFALMFLAAFVSFLAFCLQPHTPSRFGLGTGALFAAAANSFVVGSSLPESSAVTLADQLQIMTILLIFIVLAVSTFSLHLFNRHKETLSRKVDLAAVSILPVAYIGATYWLLTH